jgi:uncharacterized protein (DUF58 family)
MPASPAQTALGDATPAALAATRGLELRARRVVDGVLQGLHRSPHHGSSIEFAEHKPYAPGDDLRHLDWKVYARSDRDVIRKFEQETNLHATMVLDASASMAYGAEGGLTKHDWASVFLVALTQVLLRQQDAVGLVRFAAAVAEVLPPRARVTQLPLLISTLERGAGRGATDLAGALHHVLGAQRRRGLVFIFSDFFGDHGLTAGSVRQLVGRGHAVTLFSVLDGDELTLPFEDMTLFEGLETRARLLVEPALVRSAYLKELARHQARIRAMALDAGAEFVALDTRTPPSEALRTWLQDRRATRTLGARR